MSETLYEFINTELWYDEMCILMCEPPTNNSKARKKQIDRWCEFLDIVKVGRRYMYTKITGDYIPPPDETKYSNKLKKLILSTDATMPMKRYFKEWFLVDTNLLIHEEKYLKYNEILTSKMFKLIKSNLNTLSEKSGFNKIYYGEVLYKKRTKESVPENFDEEEYELYDFAYNSCKNNRLKVKAGINAVVDKYNYYSAWREFNIRPHYQTHLTSEEQLNITNSLNKELQLYMQKYDNLIDDQYRKRIFGVLQRHIN